MQASDLHVVTCRVNPLGWKAPEIIYKDFEQHMLDCGVKLTVVECVHGERGFLHDTNPHVRHVGVRAQTMLWTKENLINIGFRHNPHARYLGWVDADVFFEDPDWARDAVEALQLYNVIQPWRTCLDRGPSGEVHQMHTSFAHQFFHGHNCRPGTKWAWSGIGGPRFPHPGYAWCATRQALEWTGGLLETGALGSGDSHMACGLIGEAAGTYSGLVSQEYKDQVLQWQSMAVRHINHNIGYTNHVINHRWHGRKIDRNYQSRWDILVKNDFHPLTDTKRNLSGVIELAGNKPKLMRDCDHYFRNRAEDANSLV